MADAQVIHQSPDQSSQDWPDESGREVIEERLEKLETLRAADPEPLLRDRGDD
jgi:hypothetical protein